MHVYSANYSPNFDISKKKKRNIKYLIFHYTGMKNEIKAIERLTSLKSKVSCHYFVKNNGSILKILPDKYISWHAGKSCWKGTKNLNKFSIGIEIQNPGHNHGYKKYNKRQVKSIINLVRKLSMKHKIKYTNILGHSDISPDRKKDPGEKFPWKKILNKKISLNYKLKYSKFKRTNNKTLNKNEKKFFLLKLKKIGYCIDLKRPQNIKNCVKAFQRRFRQDIIDGKADLECFMILKTLINQGFY